MSEQSEQASLTIRLSPADNVVVARAELLPGAPIAGTNVTCLDRIPRRPQGRRAARSPRASRSGNTTRSSASPPPTSRRASMSTCTTVAMHEFDRDYAFGADARADRRIVPEAERATFQGYRRANGKVGTRNYIGILTTVNCSATVARLIAPSVERRTCWPTTPTSTASSRSTHGTGCGMAGSGEGYAQPAAHAVGLCPPPELRRRADGRPRLRGEPDRLPAGSLRHRSAARCSSTMTIQDAGGTAQDHRGRHRRCIREMLPRRQRGAPRAVSRPRELMLALQCGGSDGYSGITANPALGARRRPAGARTAAPPSCPRRRRSTAPSTC